MLLYDLNLAITRQTTQVSPYNYPSAYPRAYPDVPPMPMTTQAPRMAGGTPVHNQKYGGSSQANEDYTSLASPVSAQYFKVTFREKNRQIYQSLLMNSQTGNFPCNALKNHIPCAPKLILLVVSSYSL